MNVVEQTTYTSKSPRRIPSTVRFGAQVLTEFWTQLEDGKARAEGSQSIAGLLFGISEHDLLRVKVLRPVPVDTAEERPHAGTTFERSLAAAQADPELLSLHLVGWYRFRCPDDVTPLTDSDIEFHNRRFRRATDIAVILKPKEHGGISIDSVDLYGRSSSNTAISSQDYRFGSLLLGDGTHFDAPKDVLMKESVADDYDLRVLQVLDSIDRVERREAWKRLALRFKAIVPLGLRPKWMRTTEIDPTALSSRRLNPPSRTGSAVTRLGGVAAGVFIVAFGVALAWLYGRPLLSSLPSALFHGASASAPLNMRVEPQVGGTLLVKWDAHSAAARSAKSGSVQIDDGSEHHDLSLDPNQIANGSVLYTPVSKDLTFQLRVVETDGTPVSESMRIVNGSKAALATHLIPGARPKTAAITASVSKEKRGSPKSDTSFHAKTRPLTEPAKDQPSEKAPSRLEASANLVTARRSPVTSTVASTPSANGSPTATPRSTNAATANGPRPAQYVAPRPLKQVMPNAINPTSLAFPGPTEVEVEVRIDDQGRVTEARLLDSRPYNYEIFTNAALAAAKEWIFEPAKMYGKNVPSSHSIKFHFHSQIARQ
jgi:TonB family protein